MNSKKIYRSKENRIIAGVCSGLAEYFETDPVIVRIIFIFLVAGGGAGLIIYALLWLTIPERGQEHAAPEHQPEHNHPGSPEHHKAHDDHHTKGTAGFFLILIGVLFLFKNMFPMFAVEKYWPLLLIFLGVALMFRKRPL